MSRAGVKRRAASAMYFRLTGRSRGVGCLLYRPTCGHRLAMKSIAGECLLSGGGERESEAGNGGISGGAAQNNRDAKAGAS